MKLTTTFYFFHLLFVGVCVYVCFFIAPFFKLHFSLSEEVCQTPF